MKDALAEKLRQGRPVNFTGEEAALLHEALRRAMATTLEIAPEDIRDDALVFDELGLDSIDAFDLLDQLAEQFDVKLEPDDLPAEMIYGKEGLRFREFVELLLTHFRATP